MSQLAIVQRQLELRCPPKTSGPQPESSRLSSNSLSESAGEGSAACCTGLRESPPSRGSGRSRPSRPSWPPRARCRRRPGFAARCRSRARSGSDVFRALLLQRHLDAEVAALGEGLHVEVAAVVLHRLFAPGGRIAAVLLVDHLATDDEGWCISDRTARTARRSNLRARLGPQLARRRPAALGGLLPADFFVRLISSVSIISSTLSYGEGSGMRSRRISLVGDIRRRRRSPAAPRPTRRRRCTSLSRPRAPARSPLSAGCGTSSRDGFFCGAESAGPSLEGDFGGAGVIGPSLLGDFGPGCAGERGPSLLGDFEPLEGGWGLLPGLPERLDGGCIPGGGVSLTPLSPVTSFTSLSLPTESEKSSPSATSFTSLSLPDLP